MKTTRQRLMELAGLIKEDYSFEELMDMAKGLKSFKQIGNAKFELENEFLGKKRIMQVEPIQGKPSRMKVTYNSGAPEEVSVSVVYNTLYNAKLNADFENNRLGSKTKKAVTPTKGIKVRDDEGEAVTTLVDISNAAELVKRIEQEPEEYQQVWAEIPYAFDVVGPDSMYNTTEDDVADLEHYPPTTYDKWIKGYREWAQEQLSQE